MKKVFFLFFLLQQEVIFSFPRAFEMNLTQVFESLVAEEETKVEGKMTYMAPEFLYFIITAPQTRRMTYVQNGEKRWRFTPAFIEGEKHQLMISQGGEESPFVAVFEILRKQLEDPSLRLEHAELKIEKGHTLNLTFFSPLKEKFALNWAKLTFKDKKRLPSQLRTIQLSRTDGQVTLFRVESFKELTNLKSSFFHFEAPENTKTIY